MERVTRIYRKDTNINKLFSSELFLTYCRFLDIDIDAVRQAHEDGLDFSTEHDEMSALFFILSQNKIDISTYVITTLDIFSSFSLNQIGRIILYLVKRKQFTLAKLLLQKRPDADINAWRDSDFENSIIHLAILTEKPDLDLIKALCELAPPADLNLRNLAGEIPILTATNHHRWSIVEYFLSLPSFYSQFNSYYQLGTVLTQLLKDKQYDLASQLLTKAPTVNKNIRLNGSYPIHFAAQAGEHALSLVKKLCELKPCAEFWRDNDNYQSAYYLANKMKREDVLLYFSDHSLFSEFHPKSCVRPTLFDRLSLLQKIEYLNDIRLYESLPKRISSAITLLKNIFNNATTANELMLAIEKLEDMENENSFIRDNVSSCLCATSRWKSKQVSAEWSKLMTVAKKKMRALDNNIQDPRINAFLDEPVNIWQNYSLFKPKKNKPIGAEQHNIELIVGINNS